MWDWAEAPRTRASEVRRPQASSRTFQARAVGRNPGPDVRRTIDGPEYTLSIYAAPFGSSDLRRPAISRLSIPPSPPSPSIPAVVAADVPPMPVATHTPSACCHRAQDPPSRVVVYRVRQRSHLRRSGRSLDEGRAYQQTRADGHRPSRRPRDLWVRRGFTNSRPSELFVMSRTSPRGGGLAGGYACFRSRSVGS